MAGRVGLTVESEKGEEWWWGSVNKASIMRPKEAGGGAVGKSELRAVGHRIQCGYSAGMEKKKKIEKRKKEKKRSRGRSCEWMKGSKGND